MSSSSPAGLKASLEAKQWAKKRADATRAAEAKRLARPRHYLSTLLELTHACTANPNPNPNQAREAGSSCSASGFRGGGGRLRAWTRGSGAGHASVRVRPSAARR